MSRRKLHRLSTSILVMLALLFAQLALAAYVCPGQAGTGAMADMAAAGEPCQGMDDQQPVLCHQYAADAGKTFEAAKLPAASPPAVVLVLEVPRVIDDYLALAAPAAAASRTRPPPAPLFLSTLRLRV